MSFKSVIPNHPIYENFSIMHQYRDGFLSHASGTLLTLKDSSGYTVSDACVRNRKQTCWGIYERRYGGEFKYLYDDIPSWISDVMRRCGRRKMTLKVDLPYSLPWPFLSREDWHKMAHDTLIIPTPKKRRA
jgi:hypothetical protein